MAFGHRAGHARLKEGGRDGVLQNNVFIAGGKAYHCL